MQLSQNRVRLLTPLLLAGVILVQVVTHLAWLPISTQVGQLAIPYLMSRGMTLFGNLIENRPPTEAALIAVLFRIFPTVDPVLIVRMLNLILVLALTLLIYTLARRLSGSTLAGICAVLFWALWEPVYGNILFYFDALVGAVFAFTVLVWLITERRELGWLAPLLCGLLLGGATLFKQPAWAGVILFAVWFVIGGKRGRHLPIFILGVLVFPLLVLAIVAAQGNLATYLYWNFEFHLFPNVSHGQMLTGNFVRKLLLANVFAPAFVLLMVRQRQQYWPLAALLWLAGGATLLPNFGEIYAMGHMPLLAVMSGIVIARTLAGSYLPGNWRNLETSQVTLAGVAFIIAIGWGWTVISTYAPGPLGRASIPAYDEFKPLAQRILSISSPDDTLYVLPCSSSSAFPVVAV